MHHMTSKIKKLVSHKQIDTNIKRSTKFSKQKLSQTKNVLPQNNKYSYQSQTQQDKHGISYQRGRSTKQRRHNSNKSKSNSRSSGKRTYSGSSKHLRSRSNKARSSSENQRILSNINELAQYSFDVADSDH